MLYQAFYDTPGHIGPIVRVIGIVGNVLLLLTLHRARLFNSPFVYLKCIALASLVHLLAMMAFGVNDCSACQFSADTYYYLITFQW